MAVTQSVMSNLGTDAPDFNLPIANPSVDDRDGDTRSLSDFNDAAVLVVVFMCNHCPYVVHIEEALVEVAQRYQQRGVAFVGISSNNASQYPQDGFDKMAERAEQKQYSFPYLYDEPQDVARAYGAVCTPDFFVYDTDRRLVYRGRFDATRPGQGTATGADLSCALNELLETGEVTMEQNASMGCNIKWK